VARGAGGSKNALSTFFSAIGQPFSGCGTPPSVLKDDKGKALPWVALNTKGPFSKGANCGRFIKIKLGQNCVGGGNKKFEVCVGNGSARPPPAYSDAPGCCVYQCLPN